MNTETGHMIRGTWKKTALTAAAAAFLAVPGSAAENIYSAISSAFPSASPLLIILIAVTLIVLLGLIVVWEVFKSDKNNYHQTTQPCCHLQRPEYG